jgi:hypothetical protein
MDSAMAPVFLALGLAIVLYGIFNPGPYYNEDQMPLTEEERKDKRPATKTERSAYIACGILLAAWGLYGLRNSL